MEKIYILKDFPPIYFLGSNNSNLRLLQDIFPGKIIVRGEKLKLIGNNNDIKIYGEGIKNLLLMAEKGEILDKFTVSSMFSGEEGGQGGKEKSHSIKTPKKIIRAKTSGQKIYIKAIEEIDIVVCIGPSGTGKTYLAVAKAVETLMQKKYERIVLVRPAVEAGENLGFLPGDYREKIDPYLRPLYDSLIDMVSREKLTKLYNTQTVEVAPLAFMRGRTLNDAFIILDEAQNTTTVQMKMFLTRLGNGSKAIVTGDITQIDLVGKEASGLIKIQKILENVEGVKFVYLTKEDVVRRNLVQKIVEAYEKYSDKAEK